MGSPEKPTNPGPYKAKTNRLKNSSIPQTQRILNSENLEFEKQNLKRKLKFPGVRNIEKRNRLY